MGVPQSSPSQLPLHLSPIRDLQGTGFSCRGWPGDKANRLSVLRLPGKPQLLHLPRAHKGTLWGWDRLVCSLPCARGAAGSPNPALEGTCTGGQSHSHEGGDRFPAGRNHEGVGGPSPQKAPSIWGATKLLPNSPQKVLHHKSVPSQPIPTYSNTKTTILHTSRINFQSFQSELQPRAGCCTQWGRGKGPEVQNSPINDELVVGGRFVTHRAHPGGLFLIHL